MRNHGMEYTNNYLYVEEAIQNVYINLFCLRESIEFDKSIKAYILTALRNEIFQIYKKESRRVEHQSLQCDISDLSEEVDLYLSSQNHDNEYQEERIVLLKNAIRQLSKKQQEIIYATYAQIEAAIDKEMENLMQDVRTLKTSTNKPYF